MAAVQDKTILNQHFTAFSKLGDMNSDGRLITYSQAQKWLLQAKIIGKKMSSVQAADMFNKFRTPALNYNDFMVYIDDIAICMRMTPEEMRKKLGQVQIPTQSPATPKGSSH